MKFQYHTAGIANHPKSFDGEGIAALYRQAL